jgi:hypothetical protein
MTTARTATTVGIICGGGVLPFAVADAVLARGRTPVLFALRGQAEPARVARYRHHWIYIGQFGRLLQNLRAERCGDVIFIGSATRFSVADVRLDWLTLRLMPKVLSGLRGGDDHALRTVASVFEEKGFHVVGIGDLAPELLMPAGTLTRRAPDADAAADIAIGRTVLKAMSPFDIGQGTVVIDRHVVAVEDIEGTDALLARVARLRNEGRLRAKSGRGVLVKAPKSGQDRRLDLPAFGPRTVEGVVAAGLAGIAVAAGSTIVVEGDRLVGLADQAGIFVVGVAPEETPS